tara:strand:+ start:500 stop:718 length:219 start_codon:yes stop_codon:yes gene_type:complete
MNKNLRIEGAKVFMCCGKAGCPSVEYNDEGLVEISDDHGNKVKMEESQARLIAQAVKELSDRDNPQDSKVLR